MRKKVLVIAGFILSGVCLFPQNRFFPQNMDYAYGFRTSEISAIDIQITYERWKKLYLKKCNGMCRVCVDDTNVTISEGMGYGMLLTAYLGEKETFDGLLEFYKTKKTDKALNLMAWRVTRDSIIDPGSATDGDLDVAFALIVAHYQWGEDYLKEAKDIISILKEHYFVNCNGVYTMKPGGHWGGCDLTNISYYSPAYFRIFAQETGEAFWDTVADDAYTILYNGADDNTGLVPDWQSYDGVPGGTSDSDWKWRDYYRYDACRVPWRIALDYLWSGDKDARNFCIKVSNFADSIGPADIVDGYLLDGTPHPEAQWNNSPFVGSFAVGGMSYSQTMVDSFASRLLYLDCTGEDDQYFNLSLRCLYMLVLTGNFWEPGTANVHIYWTD
jgi:endo-1,4-beta-D-glucanase Y